MCNLSEVILESGIEQGMERGIEQGLEMGQNKIILHMLSQNLSPEQISNLCGIPMDRIIVVMNDRQK